MCIDTIQISPPPFQRDNKLLDSLQVCVSVRACGTENNQRKTKFQFHILCIIVKAELLFDNL